MLWLNVAGLVALGSLVDIAGSSGTRVLRVMASSMMTPFWQLSAEDMSVSTIVRTLNSMTYRRRQASTQGCNLLGLLIP